MNRFSQRLTSTARVESKPQSGLTMVLAYRDFTHELLGKKYCEEVSEQLCEFVGVTEWKFEMLAVAGMSEIAAVEAASARVLVIATSGEEELPPTIKAWLERWCSRKREGPAELVVILTWDPDHSQGYWPDYFQIEAQTRAAGITLIIHPYDVPSEGEHPDSPARGEGFVTIENSFREILRRPTRKEWKE